VDGFAARHEGFESAVVDGALVLSGADGAVAELETPWPPLDLDVDEAVAALAAHASASRTAVLVLVRRGGYAAGIARDGALLAHAVGTRYVQGRTAAGGWSQQRFARRRSGQAAALAGSAVDAVLKVLGTAARPPDVLVPGGDRGLVAEVLSDPRLARVAALPRGPLLDVRDPRLAVLQETAQRARAVRIRVTDPASPPQPPPPR
jgi:Actinobacteria/chloroflexi VLRF1 release factor